MAEQLPEAISRLFWDTDPQAVDFARHADYVMERVMSRGGLEAMRWLRAAYTREQLAGFLVRKGTRLSARDLAYWCVVAGLELPIPRGGGRPAWAGP